MPRNESGAPSPAAVLTAGYDAFNRRDVGLLRELMVDDFRWNEAEGVPGRRQCASAEEFAAYVAGFDRLWAEFSFEALELEPVADDTVIARVLGRGRGRAGGDPVELEIHHVWRFRAGKVSRMDAFLHAEQAADAARASPHIEEG